MRAPAPLPKSAIRCGKDDSGVDYENYLSDEVKRFIAETEAFYPADLDLSDWAEVRAVYDRMCVHFRAPKPSGLQVLDRTIAGVPVRIYGTPSDMTILFAHGGGFVLGGLESHDDLCADIADRTGCQVVAVDYRLSPEHRHPAAFDDLSNVAEELCAKGPVVLCGDSAGGTLCAALAGARADLGLRGQVLLYPLLGYPAEGGSFDIHAHAPMLTTEDLKVYAEARGGAPDDPTANPAFGDLGGLPPTRLFPAECDPLCDDAVRYHEACVAAGVDSTVTVQMGMVHGWQRGRRNGAEMQACFDQIIKALRELTSHGA